MSLTIIDPDGTVEPKSYLHRRAVAKAEYNQASDDAKAKLKAKMDAGKAILKEGRRSCKGTFGVTEAGVWRIYGETFGDVLLEPRASEGAG